LEQLASASTDFVLCHCRRGLLRALGGSARCALHRRPARP
jgi:hypothetical protein